jgi:hypothetical protein
MSNIKKARYTGAPKLLNQKLSVIKVTGTSKNIKQINFILPKEYGIKKIKENLFILFIESKGILATLARLATNDWVVITEDNHVDKIPEENFDKIITLVD